MVKNSGSRPPVIPFFPPGPLPCSSTGTREPNEPGLLAWASPPPTPLPALSSLGPVWSRAPLWRGPFAALLLAPIVMATLFCGAAPVVARSPFCRPEEDPFLLLESTLRSLQEILRRSQGGPLRRPWDEQPYGEEEITLLEEEVMPAIEQCLLRVEELDQRLVSQRGA
jgi:hypothetical protein